MLQIPFKRGQRVDIARPCQAYLRSVYGKVSGARFCSRSRSSPAAASAAASGCACDVLAKGRRRRARAARARAAVRGAVAAGFRGMLRSSLVSALPRLAPPAGERRARRCGGGVSAFVADRWVSAATLRARVPLRPGNFPSAPPPLFARSPRRSPTARRWQPWSR